MLVLVVAGWNKNSNGLLLSTSTLHFPALVYFGGCGQTTGGVVVVGPRRLATIDGRPFLLFCSSVDLEYRDILLSHNAIHWKTEYPRQTNAGRRRYVSLVSGPGN